MEIKELYTYLYDLETNRPDIEKIAEKFIKIVTEDIEAYISMVCYVDVLNRLSEEFKYFNNLHAYILRDLKHENYTQLKDELVKNPELFGEPKTISENMYPRRGEEVVRRRKEYGFSLEQIPGGLAESGKMR